MALPSAISYLLLSLLVAVTPLACTCEEERAPMAMAGSSLIQCYDPRTNATRNATESFRANLLPLLAALPSAAAPTGFASLSSNGLAFVRGLCFGEATVPSECRVCLSVAARNLTAGCDATTRRAGVWTERCFAAYADTRASSSAENTFRSRVLLRGSNGAVRDTDETYDRHDMVVDLAQDVALDAAADIDISAGPRMLATVDADTPVDRTVRSTVHVLAQCARDRTAAECANCLQDSAGAVNWDIDADLRDGGVAAAVLGFNCYIRFNVSTALVSQGTATASPAVITTGGFVAIVVILILCALMEV